jgi:hypothetical protein
MMGTETVPETLDFNELTWLSAREDFIKSYPCTQTGPHEGSPNILKTTNISGTPQRNH